MIERPKSGDDLQKREAAGVIRASRFIRKYAHSYKKINADTIMTIHKEIFKEAWPEIAGQFRTENLKISGSKHLPPHFSQIPKRFTKMNDGFQQKIEELKMAKGILLTSNEPSDGALAEIDKVIETAAWIHHQITYIHPFREGNGRTARLAANLILERYGLVGISIKIERENKQRYCKSLAQIDKNEDYQPLISLITEGLIDRYNNVAVKYYTN